MQKLPWNCQKSMYLQTNGDFEKATLFSFQKGRILKKMGISTGFYWFFLTFSVLSLIFAPTTLTRLGETRFKSLKGDDYLPMTKHNEVFKVSETSTGFNNLRKLSAHKLQSKNIMDLSQLITNTTGLSCSQLAKIAIRYYLGHFRYH